MKEKVEVKNLAFGEDIQYIFPYLKKLTNLEITIEDLHSSRACELYHAGGLENISI